MSDSDSSYQHPQRSVRQPHFIGVPCHALRGEPALDITIYIDISRIMDIIDATEAFSALSQETRLAVLRLLIEAGAEGVPAGDIARHFGTPQNTMSTNLAILARAGFVTSRRDGRSVIYAADYAGLRRLITFLLQDCCKGRPEVCTPLLDAALAPAAAPCCPLPESPEN